MGGSNAAGGIGSALGMGAGYLLAPFTGGLSIPASMAIGGAVGGAAGSAVGGGNTQENLKWGALGGAGGFGGGTLAAGMGAGVGAGLTASELQALEMSAPGAYTAAEYQAAVGGTAAMGAGAITGAGEKAAAAKVATPWYETAAKGAALYGGMNYLTGRGAQSAEEQAKELYASRFPNADAIASARLSGNATASQDLLLAQKKLYEEGSSRNIGGGMLQGANERLARESMKINANRNLALTQYANTPNSSGITPWKTQEEQMAEMLAALTGTAGGVYAYKNLFA